MSNEIIQVEQVSSIEETQRSAETDEQLVELWLHGLSKHTERAYRKDWSDFRAFIRKPIRSVTLGDIQAFAIRLNASRLNDGSRHRKLSTLKSLFSFAHRIGFLAFDTARPLRLPPVRETLNARIMAETEVLRMIALERRPRDRAMLTLLYASAVRVSELVALRWSDAQPRGDSGQITVFGKGGKTRTLLLPVSTWRSLLSIRGNAREDDPIFRSRKGGHLDPSSVLRVVKAAAKRAGIDRPVSPHWFRHGHASHALDRGAPIHLVQAQLGHRSLATTSAYSHARPNESSSSFLPL
jgi:integrase/recombinase XerD